MIEGAKHISSEIVPPEADGTELLYFSGGRVVGLTWRMTSSLHMETEDEANVALKKKKRDINRNREKYSLNSTDGMPW